MKKITAAILVLFMFVLISCSPDPKPRNTVVGKWKCDQGIVYAIYDFKENYDYSMTVYWSDGTPFVAYSGKYTLTENTIKLEHDEVVSKYMFQDGNLLVEDTDSSYYILVRIE